MVKSNNRSEEKMRAMQMCVGEGTIPEGYTFSLRIFVNNLPSVFILLAVGSISPPFNPAKVAVLAARPAIRPGLARIIWCQMSRIKRQKRPCLHNVILTPPGSLTLCPVPVVR